MKPDPVKDPLELARAVLKESSTLKRVTLHSVEVLTGDASTREFFRLKFSDHRPPSCILVQHNGVVERGALSQEQSTVLVGRLFADHGVRVPDVYHHSQERRVLLLEDIGARGLWRFTTNELDDQGEKLKDIIGSDWLAALFKRAIDVITKLHAIPHDPNHLVFQKSLTFERYRREIQEFLEYYAGPQGLKKSAQEVFGFCFDAICETVLSFPKALSHFDFTAYNLFVSDEGEIRLLDFQDACCVVWLRDLISLINDRDMDQALGKSRHAELIRYFRERVGDCPDFDFHYDVTALHWDFRVCGRFHKLRQTKHTDRYLQWVPGTLRRLGGTLVHSHRTFPRMDDALEILVKLSPEVREGTQG